MCMSDYCIRSVFFSVCYFCFSSRRRHTRFALVTGVQTCALPIWFLISSMLRSDPRNTCRFELTDAAFQRDADQLLRLDGELHGELLHDLAAEAVHHQGDGVLLRQAALAAVEQLVLADARGGRLVLDDRLAVLGLDVGHRVGAALVADQQRVALGAVARPPPLGAP